MHTIPRCDLTLKMLKKKIEIELSNRKAQQFDIYLTVKITLSFYFYPAVRACFVIN